MFVSTRSGGARKARRPEVGDAEGSGDCFVVNDGVHVIGASGSGKSLLAHAILGILPANSEQGGTIRYHGDPLTKQAQATLRRDAVALIPQSVGYLDPLIRVGRQVGSVIYRDNSASRRSG